MKNESLFSEETAFNERYFIYNQKRKTRVTEPKLDIKNNNQKHRLHFNLLYIPRFYDQLSH
jgi:hypothetical protein